jgi:sugar phosphate isomerase/epimerase
MKLGITQLLPTALAEITLANIRQVRELGFSGTAFNVNDPPESISTAAATEFGQRCASEGVAIAEFGQYGTCFVQTGYRDSRLTTVREACRVATAMNCPVVIVGIGSHNPRGQWLADRENFTSATHLELIPALREAAKIAEDAGLVLALECHITTSLRDAETARSILDEIASPALRVHLDAVNWMTFETILENGPAIAAMYETLGPDRIAGAHSKGATLADQLIIHMDEVPTGAPGDLIDHEAVVGGLAALPGERWLVIEHLGVADMPAARARVLQAAENVGARFDELPEATG